MFKDDSKIKIQNKCNSCACNALANNHILHFHRLFEVLYHNYVVKCTYHHKSAIFSWLEIVRCHRVQSATSIISVETVMKTFRPDCAVSCAFQVRSQYQDSFGSGIPDIWTSVLSLCRQNKSSCHW